MIEQRASCPPSRVRLAHWLDRTPWTQLVARYERAFPFVRVFNFHGTPARLRDGLARTLDRIATRYRIARADELEALLAAGDTKPAAILTFDDGLANNYEVAAPLLEALGATAIFAVTARFPSIDRAQQPRWFLEHVRRHRNEEHATDDDLYSLAWDQLRDLARRGHRICCHTSSHQQIGLSTSPEIVHREIVDARGELEARIGGTVDGFCWPVAFHSVSDDADRAVRATYRYALCSGGTPLFAPHDAYRIYRTNLEASWPLEVVDYQMSGAADLASTAGRVLRRLMRRDA